MLRQAASVAALSILRQRLLDGMIELAVSESFPMSSDVVSSVLVCDELVPVVCRQNALAKMKSISVGMFCQQPFITRQVESEDGSLVERTLAAKRLKISPVLNVSSTEAIKQAVIAGLGVAMVSRLAIQTEVRAGLLVQLNVPGLRIRYPIHQVRRKGHSQSKLAVRFLSMIKESVLHH